MLNGNNEQNGQTARKFLPAVIPEKASLFIKSSCGMLRQWIVLAVVFTFLLIMMWAILGDGFSLSRAASRSVSKADAKPYKQMPSTSNPTFSSDASGHKILMEGHWLGMEVGPLTAKLARSLSIPSSVRGVLVDEVTLLSAEQGLLAGDVVVSIAGQDTPGLNSFLEASKKVRSSNKTMISVFRKGNYLSVPIKSGYELGFAQMEAAPMIRPTDTAPHRYYGACTDCHSIGSTGQLSMDMGDTIRRPLAPVVSSSPAPHRNYGKCAKCHKLLDPIFSGHNKIGAPGGL